MSISNVGDYAIRLGEGGVRFAKMAVWADNPVTQIAVNLVIIVAAVISSSVSFGATLLIAALATPFLLIGVGRFIWQLVG